jgi:hypothetical protein
MDNSVKAALITVAGGLVIAVVKWALDRKKARHDIVGKLHEITNSQIATGNNIVQHQGGVHNYFAHPTATGPFAGKVATRPSMAEIADAIIAADPYDRTQIPKKYVGLEVSWPVVFSGLGQRIGKQWYATFDSIDTNYRSVLVNIHMEEHPKLKVVKAGHPAWIEGKILTADVRIICLEDGAVITLE